MTVRAANASASRRELAAVFAVVLAAAFAVARMRAAVLGDGHDAGGSYLVSGVAGTLAFWALCAIGRRAWAFGITALLLVALGASALAAMAERRLDPAGVMSRFPAPLPEVPYGLTKAGNWIVDRSLAWTVREPSITIRTDGSMTIDGTPGTDYANLAVSSPQHLDQGLHVVVEGSVSAGAAYVGLQQQGAWIDFNTVDRPGPFRKWVIVPRNGDYQLVVAYGVVAGTRTRVDVSSLTLWR